MWIGALFDQHLTDRVEISTLKFELGILVVIDIPVTVYCDVRPEALFVGDFPEVVQAVWPGNHIGMPDPVERVNRKPRVKS